MTFYNKNIASIVEYLLLNYDNVNYLKKKSNYAPKLNRQSQIMTDGSKYKIAVLVKGILINAL